MSQLQFDILRFSELLSNFTGISKSKIDAYLIKNPVNNIFDHSASLDINKSQKSKIEELRELRNLYNNLKISDGERYIINSSAKAGEYFKNFFDGIRDKERMVCAFLDSSHKLIATKVMTEGTVSEAPVYVREIVKEALLHDTKSVILSHNHPGGSTTPSNEDINITKTIQEALKLVQISVLDHIIAAGNDFVSLAEKGYLIKENTPVYGQSNFIEKEDNLYTVGKNENNNTQIYDDVKIVNLKEKFIEKMQGEFPAVKFISDDAIKTIHHLCHKHGEDERFFSRRKLTEYYKTLGREVDTPIDKISHNYDLELVKNKIELFHCIEKVLNELKICNLKYKEEISCEGTKNISLKKEKVIEPEV